MLPKSEIEKLEPDPPSAKTTSAKGEAQEQAANLKKAASKKRSAEAPDETGSGGLCGLANSLDSAALGCGRRATRGPPGRPTSEPVVPVKAERASSPAESGSKRREAIDEKEKEESDSASTDAVVVPGLRPAGGKEDTYRLCVDPL